MVSAAKLLQVMSRLVHVPQPTFTPAHTHAVIKFIINVPLNQRSFADSLNMMKIAAHSPHASTIFAQDSRLSEKVLVAFFVESKIYDLEQCEALNQVIRTVSVNQHLSTAFLLTMAKRLSDIGRELPLSSTAVSAVVGRNYALVEELLRRVVSRMLAAGEKIAACGGDVVLTQKEMHKRKGNIFEMPELFFLLSTLRHVTTFRAIISKANSAEQIYAAARLPADIVEPVLHCVQRLPLFCDDETPPRDGEWIFIAQLVGCCDARLHGLGKQLWERKAARHGFSDTDLYGELFLPSWLAVCVCALRGAVKRDVMELWIDILSNPQVLSKMENKVLCMLLLDMVFSLQGCSKEKLREQLLVGGRRILDTLDASHASSPSSLHAVRSRLSVTRSFPPLETPEEFLKTLLMVEPVLAINNEVVGCDFIRDVAEFLRHLQKTNNSNMKPMRSVLRLLAQRILRMLQLPLLDSKHTAALVPALATFNSELRELQEKEGLLNGEDNELRSLFNKIAIRFIQEHTMQSDVFLIAVFLQMMELLEFTSDTRYTTAVRELILAALRSLPERTREINSHTAQHCIDITLRAVRFHVLDEEILKAARMALRHAADSTVIGEMCWNQRAITVDRGILIYRALTHYFSTSKEARRLAKVVLNMAAVIASEKFLPCMPQSQDGKLQKGSQRWKFLRRCAQYMWTLALRASLSPIPRTPIDRYLTPMLQFASKHWVAEELAVNKVVAGEQHIDEDLSLELFDSMLGMLYKLLLSAFTERTLFNANLRRNKLIISTACDILQKNSAFLSPRVWFSTQRILSNLPPPLITQFTPLQQGVLRTAIKHTLRNVKACGNRGTWHLSEKQKTRISAKDNLILGSIFIGDMFACADLIDDQELRLYLISLMSEHLEKIDTDKAATGTAMSEQSPPDEEKARLMCLKKTLATFRRGSVLYY